MAYSRMDKACMDPLSCMRPRTCSRRRIYSRRMTCDRCMAYSRCTACSRTDKACMGRLFWHWSSHRTCSLLVQ